jgi:hypothetical protein
MAKKNWAQIHDEVQKLYWEQGKPLSEVMKIVKETFNFEAW